VTATADPAVPWTVHGVLAAAAAAQPSQLLRFPSEKSAVSYRELADSVLALAARLVTGELAGLDGLTAGKLAGGVRRGTRIGVLSPNGPEFLSSLFAVTAAGGAACPLPLPAGLADAAAYGERLARIADVAEMSLVLVSPRLLDLAGQLAPLLPGVAFASPGETADAGLTSPDQAQRAALPEVTPADIAIVQFTSGSTALPKGVQLTHRNVLAGLAAISEGIALGPEDSGGFWLPLFHDMGLFGVLAGLQAGIPLHIWSPISFVKQPHRWLREFLASGATITAMPDFGYRTLTAAVSPAAAAELDMSHWRIAFNGAEPVQWPTVDQFTSRFAVSGFRPEALRCVYGMAEATLAITFPPLGREPVFDWVDRDKLASGMAVTTTAATPGARAVAAVGRPVAGMELRVARVDSGVDGGADCGADSGAPGSEETVSDGVVGEVLIRGASVTSGYLGMAPAGADGWLRTGDLAYTRAGEVFITGRLKEMITVRGANYYPHDVELIARVVPGVFRGHCAAAAGHGPDGGEAVVLVAETTLHGDAASELAAELRRRVAAELGPTQVAVRLVKPRAIPRTSSGKIRRLASLELPARGDVPPAVKTGPHQSNEEQNHA
jgi:fatty-acyl-CoA synthase